MWQFSLTWLSIVIEMEQTLSCALSGLSSIFSFSSATNDIINNVYFAVKYVLTFLLLTKRTTNDQVTQEHNVDSGICRLQAISPEANT